MADLNVNLKIGANVREFQEALRSSSRQLQGFSNDVRRQSSGIGQAFSQIGIGVAAAAASFRVFPGLLSAAANDFSRLSGVARKANGDFIGISKNIAVLSLGLRTVGDNLRTSENNISRAVGSISANIGTLGLGVSAAITGIVAGVGILADSLGTRLVNATNRALESFSRFQKTSLIFERTIEGFNREFGDGAGDIEFWTNRIREAGIATGESQGNLQAVAAELVAAGTQFGLSGQELSTLLDVILDYSTITGDSFQTTIDFIGALQGNTQAVIKYGIKLNESSLQQLLYKEGVDRTVSSLSDKEKQQLRLNKILEIYPAIAGKAAAINQTLAGQQRRLANNLNDIRIRFGEGVSIIEGFNISAAATNLVLENVSDSVFQATGFLAALGGRLLQIIGTLLKFSAVILTVRKGIDLLNIGLSSGVFATVANRTIPLLNRSFAQLAPNITRSVAATRSANQLFRLLGNTALRTLTSGLSLATIAVRGFAASLFSLALNPVVLAIGAIVGAVFGLVRALQLIEARTQVFSTVWSALTEILSASTSVFSPIIEFFGNLTQNVLRAGRVVAGFFVDTLAGGLQFVVDLLRSNPLNIFSQQQIAQFDQVSARLQTLRDQLQGVGFDIAQLPDAEVDVKLKNQGGDRKIAQADVSKLVEQIRKAADQAIQEASSRITTARLAGATNEELNRLKDELGAQLTPVIESARQRLFELYNTTGDLEALRAAESLGTQLLSISRQARVAKKDLDDTAQSFSEAINKIDIDNTTDFGLSAARQAANGLANALGQVGDGTKSAKDAFTDFARSFLRQIGEMIIQSTVLRAIQAGFGASSAAAGNSTTINTGAGVANIAASGGFVSGGQISRRFAEGGPVVGPGSGTSDSIPAMLSNGEFVTDARTVRAFGVDFFTRLKEFARGGMTGASIPNFAGARRFADGGFVDSLGSDFMSANQNSTASSNMNIEIVNNSSSEAQVSRVERTGEGPDEAIKIFLDDLKKNGPASRSMQQAFGLRRKGFK